MFKTNQIILLFLLAVCAWSANIKLWPYPNQIEIGKKIVCVDHKNIHVNTTYKDDVLDEYAKRVFRETFMYSTSKKNDKCIDEVRIQISSVQKVLNDDMNESYKLSVSDDSSAILIASPTLWGTYHALQTLSQLISFNFEDLQYEIKYAPISIEDSPRFKHRGLLIDTSRHFLPLNVLKEIIHSMKYVKLNVLHWHIVDDQSIPIQSKVNPLWWNGAYSQIERYTFNDIHDIVKYAFSLGIRVIPELNIPGHDISWCKGCMEYSLFLTTLDPELCPSNTCQTPLNPASEKTIPFIQNIIKEWTQSSKDFDDDSLFLDKYFHLGGNDVNTDCWNKVDDVIDWMKKNKKTDKDTYKYFLEEAKSTLLKYQKTVIFYNEVYDNFQGALTNETVIQVMNNLNSVVDIINAGYPVIISDIDHWQVNKIMNIWSVAYDNELYNLVQNEQQRKMILGGEAVLFSEFVDPSDLFSTLYPAAAAVAEKLWSNNTSWTSRDVQPRLQQFRYYLHARSIGASPLTCKNNRDIPEGPGSIFDQ